MLSFFTTAKAFAGHNNVIQRNALRSWKLLHPDVEVILFGDDEGAAEVCSDLGLKHESFTERHESGAKYLNYIFDQAQRVARHDYLCFSNCDIVLTSDFLEAFEKAKAWHERFLLVSQRWDLDITEPLDFARPEWAREVREMALTHGFQQDEYWIDCFLFRKGMYTDMPAMIVGHCYWDNWMIWRALSEGVPVLDVSRFLVPIHQNHGYNPKYGRVKGVPTDPLSQWNLNAIGGNRYTRQIDAATHRMTRDGRIRRALMRNTYELRKTFRHRLWFPAWHGLLSVTRPLRSVLRLRSKASIQSDSK